MTQRTVQRFVAVAALAGILFLTAAPVQARDLGPAPRVMQWLQDLWSKGVSTLLELAESRSPAPGVSGSFQKESGVTDPDGSHTSGTTPPAGTNADNTGGTDPNG